MRWPDSIPAGDALFEVTNGGTADHGFAIESADATLDSLGVDELDVVRVTLEPGTYVVFSPVEGDRDAGLERQLTVTEASASDAPDALDEAVEQSERQQEMDDDGS